MIAFTDVAQDIAIQLRADRTGRPQVVAGAQLVVQPQRRVAVTNVGHVFGEFSGVSKRALTGYLAINQTTINDIEVILLERRLVVLHEATLLTDNRVHTRGLLLHIGGSDGNAVDAGQTAISMCMCQKMCENHDNTKTTTQDATRRNTTQQQWRARGTAHTLRIAPISFSLFNHN